MSFSASKACLLTYDFQHSAFSAGREARPARNVARRAVPDLVGVPRSHLRIGILNALFRQEAQ